MDTFKKNLIATGITTSLMVLFMQTYHILMATGVNSSFIPMFIQKAPLTLTVAIILNFILVGPVVKMIFFKLIFKTAWESKPVKMNLVLSTMIILGMVSLMSIFGIIVTFGVHNISLLKYVHTWLLNFLVAVPIQLIVVGPTSRYLISKIVSDTDSQMKEIK